MKAYLKWIRQLPCSVCGDDTGCDPHHLKGLKQGKNMKSDVLVIPLCRRHHDAFHNDPNQWEVYYGSQLGHLGKTLIQATLYGWRMEKDDGS